MLIDVFGDVVQSAADLLGSLELLQVLDAGLVGPLLVLLLFV